MTGFLPMGYEQGDMPLSGQHLESSTIFIPATVTMENACPRWHYYVMEKGRLIHIELGMSEKQVFIMLRL